MTKQAAEGYRRSIIPMAFEAMGGRLSDAFARELAAQDHQRMVLSRPRASSRSRAISIRRAGGSSIPPDFLRIRTAKVSCVSSRSAASARAFHLRRAGIGIVAIAADRVPETAAADGSSGVCQLIMATHSPMLMAYPGARLLRLSSTAWSR